MILFLQNYVFSGTPANFREGQIGFPTWAEVDMPVPEPPGKRRLQPSTCTPELLQKGSDVGNVLLITNKINPDYRLIKNFII